MCVPWRFVNGARVGVDRTDLRQMGTTAYYREKGPAAKGHCGDTGMPQRPALNKPTAPHLIACLVHI